MYKNAVYWFVCNEVNGSSRKYTGGQSRDQSLFENGTMWDEPESLLTMLSISTGRVGGWRGVISTHPGGHHVMYGYKASYCGMRCLIFVTVSPLPSKRSQSDKPGNANDYFMKIEL